MGVNIYISGAEKNAPESHSRWREEVSNISNTYFGGIKIVDPMKHFDYGVRSATTSLEVHNYFMWLIEHCDIIIVNLDHTDVSPGTMGELEHGRNNKIPIIGFGKDKSTWYSWCEDLCEVVFDDINTVLEYAYAHYYL